MTIWQFDEENREELLRRIVADLRAGEVWGLQADSAYALVADAFSFKGVRRIQELKQQKNLITPVLIGRAVTLQGLVASVTPSMQTLIDAYWPGPLTVVAKPNPSLAWAASVDAVSVRMPVNEDLRDLAWALGPIVAVGASRGSHPAPTTAAQAAEIWGSDVENWVDSGPANSEVASTVLDFRGRMPNVIRLGVLTAKEMRVHVPSITMLAN